MTYCQFFFSKDHCQKRMGMQLDPPPLTGTPGISLRYKRIRGRTEQRAVVDWRWTDVRHAPCARRCQRAGVDRETAARALVVLRPTQLFRRAVVQFR